MIKAAVVAGMAAVAIAAFAKYGDRLTAWLEPEPPPRPFVFDNGSVREVRNGVRPPLAERAGALKRCEKNGVVTYTDRPCDAGARARKVEGTLSVVDGSPALPPASAASVMGAQTRLKRALDIDGPPLRSGQLGAVVERTK